MIPAAILSDYGILRFFSVFSLSTCISLSIVRYLLRYLSKEFGETARKYHVVDECFYSHNLFPRWCMVIVRRISMLVALIPWKNLALLLTWLFFMLLTTNVAFCSIANVLNSFLDHLFSLLFCFHFQMFFLFSSCYFHFVI